MGINKSITQEGVIDADVSFPDGPYGSGTYRNVVTLEILIQGTSVRFVSEDLTSQAQAERVARHLDGKHIS